MATTEAKTETKTATAPAEVKLPATYRAVQVVGKNEMKMVTLPMVHPRAREVLIRVISCGVCHGDMHPVQAGGKTPRVPGHEVMGYIVEVGTEVTRFKIGDRVGRGYHGGHCFQCDNCMDGEFFACGKPVGPTGTTTDGGFGEYMIAPYESVCKVADGVSMNTGGPLVCAGMTVFNALRHSGAVGGDLVAVQGIGGLGHLGIQFARQMGFRTAAISSGSNKATLAKQLGAHYYIDTSTQDASAELKKLGGAKVILATVYDAKAQSALVGGLGTNGQLLSLGVEVGVPLTIPGIHLLMGRKSVRGWYSGTARDAEDTIRMAALTGIKVHSEVFPFEKFREAFDRMAGGKCIFRVTLQIAPEPEATGLSVINAVPEPAPATTTTATAPTTTAPTTSAPAKV